MLMSPDHAAVEERWDPWSFIPPFYNLGVALTAGQVSRGHGSKLALLWGRRRVGKTALLQHFAGGKRTVFHTGAGRPVTLAAR